MNMNGIVLGRDLNQITFQKVKDNIDYCRVRRLIAEWLHTSQNRKSKAICPILYPFFVYNGQGEKEQRSCVPLGYCIATIHEDECRYLRSEIIPKR